MSRRGMKYCIICNPDDNGMKGIEGTEAIARYYLSRFSNPTAGQKGRLPICVSCIEFIENQGFEVEPLKGFENHQYFIDKRIAEEIRQDIRVCEHRWHKQFLVTQEDKYGLYDLWRCEICGYEVKKRTVDQELPKIGVML